MTEPSLFEIHRFRARIVAALRETLTNSELLEVETPTLVRSPGMEPHLRAFEVSPVECLELGTRHLHTSPEYAIKATLAELGTSVFTFARSYRDEPPTRWHHAEFTMLEWYRLGGTTSELMADCEQLLRAACNAAGKAPAWEGPFARSSIQEVLGSHSIDVFCDDDSEFARQAYSAGVGVELDWDWHTVFTIAYVELVESSLPRDVPAFVHGFPASQAALARVNPEDPRLADRFELYLPGPGGQSVELANAFGELVDPIEQRRRFESELRWRADRSLPLYPMPEPMLHGLAALGPCAGIALGVERLIVWLAEWAHDWTLDVADLLLGEPLRPDR